MPRLSLPVDLCPFRLHCVCVCMRVRTYVWQVSLRLERSELTDVEASLMAAWYAQRGRAVLALSKLWLFNNRLHERGGLAVAELLAASGPPGGGCGVTEVHLSHNFVPTSAAKRLIDVIATQVRARSGGGGEGRGSGEGRGGEGREGGRGRSERSPASLMDCVCSVWVVVVGGTGLVVKIQVLLVYKFKGSHESCAGIGSCRQAALHLPHAAAAAAPARPPPPPSRSSAAEPPSAVAAHGVEPYQRGGADSAHGGEGAEPRPQIRRAQGEVVHMSSCVGDRGRCWW